LPTGQRSSTPVIHREIWFTATAYIEGRLGEPLTVPGVARAALTSERQLQRVFAAAGITVRQFIADARMNHAAVLAVSTDVPVAEIAGLVGYGHASAFIKAFRLHHGETPAQLRRLRRVHVALPPTSSGPDYWPGGPGRVGALPTISRRAVNAPPCDA
jgi:transcriptional regulator GlxA family with amidase domain